jgi:hypothetical protein
MFPPGVQVTELCMEQLHARIAQRVSKVVECFVRLGALHVIDSASPPPHVSLELWHKLRQLVSFQPQSLRIPKLSANTEDLTLTSGFYAWEQAQPGLRYDMFMEVASAPTLLRDDTYAQWILAECSTGANGVSESAASQVCMCL